MHQFNMSPTDRPLKPAGLHCLRLSEYIYWLFNHGYLIIATNLLVVMFYCVQGMQWLSCT